MASLNNTSWFLKYNPKTIEEYIFDSPDHEVNITKWISQGYCDGNLLLSGPPGTGKSSLISVLVHAFIKTQHDFRKVKSRSVAEIDELLSYVVSKPVKSTKKIIVIEEFDRLSKEAMTQLKDTYLEKYQATCTFIATTNYVSKIDPAVKTRFTHLGFTGRNIEGVIKKCQFILNSENIVFDQDALSKFINIKYKLGLRSIINELQIHSLNGQIDFSSITAESSNLEEEVVELYRNILKTIVNTTDFTTRRAILLNPLSSPIQKEWARLSEILQFSRDLDYVNIYELIDQSIYFLPIKLLLNKYANEIDSRKLMHLSFIGFTFESMKSMIEI